uniref:Uncharacterized protein n=1 Tax=Kalanchoe fedtschenkoi TaxID=63787 RepID=A0A7N0UKZ9_KALFE
MAESLFNFVIGWTPLCSTRTPRGGRYEGSFDVPWGFQIFLTNSMLLAPLLHSIIPYMAIRQNEADAGGTPRERSQLCTVMRIGTPVVGHIGGATSLISVLWAFYVRMDENFGERLEFSLTYLGSEKLAYAFIWECECSTIFTFCACCWAYLLSLKLEDEEI